MSTDRALGTTEQHAPDFHDGFGAPGTYPIFAVHAIVLPHHATGDHIFLSY